MHFVTYTCGFRELSTNLKSYQKNMGSDNKPVGYKIE